MPVKTPKESTASTLLIGADPELFVFDTKKKIFVSGHDIFPGTKQDPYVIGPGAIQRDGTAFEFNIKPADTKRAFTRSIASMLVFGQKILDEKHKQLKLLASPTADFSKDYFDSLPEEVKLLGCEPDYNAYTGKQNKTPNAEVTFRTGAGHIHLGWTEFVDATDKGHFVDCMKMVHQLDAALFIPSLLWDGDRKRRELYGKIGSFRPKFYGLEYRVLSNQWLTDNDLIEWIYDATQWAYALAEDNVWLQVDDKDIRGKMTYLEQGKELRLIEAIKYTQALIQDYAFPKFPEEYYE